MPDVREQRDRAPCARVCSGPGRADHRRGGGALIHRAQFLFDQFPQAITWVLARHGAFHHAFADRAEGFCYLNDVVLACMELASAGKRVMFLALTGQFYPL